MRERSAQRQLVVVREEEHELPYSGESEQARWREAEHHERRAAHQMQPR